MLPSFQEQRQSSLPLTTASSYSSSSSSLPSFVDNDDDDRSVARQRKRRSVIAILIPLFLVAFSVGATLLNQRRVFRTTQELVSWMEHQENRNWVTQEAKPLQPNHQQLEGGGGGGGSVGACLLIKDDNHWLVEWLAFHYHVMPLRHLVVVVDPLSKTSPLDILRRWTDTDLMTIDLWRDEDFMPETPSQKMLRTYGNNTDLMNHRLRQGTFYMQCLDHFKHKRMGVSWVYLTDTDEFTSLNYNYHNETHEIVAQQLIQQHPIQQPGSVLSFLREHQQQTSQVQNCLYLNRYMVGSSESSTDLVHKYATANGDQFLTQRFLKHNPRKSRFGKNMVHLDAIGNNNNHDDDDDDDLQLQPDVHRVSRHCPTQGESTQLESSQYIKINHYVGTLEQFFFRSDPRATKGKGHEGGWQRDSSHYKNLGQGANATDTTSQAWIQGFVDSVGTELAQTLLEGVGQVDGWLETTMPPINTATTTQETNDEANKEGQQQQQQQQTHTSTQKPEPTRMTAARDRKLQQKKKTTKKKSRPLRRTKA